MKFQYTGEQPVTLAQVGRLNPGDVFLVTNADISAGLLKHGSDEYKVVADSTPVTGPVGSGVETEAQALLRREREAAEAKLAEAAAKTTGLNKPVVTPPGEEQAP